MEIHVREAEPDDAGVIVALVGELVRLEGMGGSLTTDYVSAYLMAPGVRLLLAEAAGQVVGLISYSIRPNLFHAANCCLVDELIVQEDARGRGVGGALLEAVIERARAAGCAEVALSTMPDNAKAIAFYRQHGFTDEALALERHFGGEHSC